MSASPDTVYFLKPVGSDGPYKIGCSSNPEARRRICSRGSPVELELACTIDGGVHLERRFHALFRDDHIRCEWFHASPRMEWVIQQIIRGTFDTSGLPAPVKIDNLKGGKTVAERRAIERQAAA